MNETHPGEPIALASVPPTVERIAFLGTPVEAVVALQKLVAAGIDIGLVVTQPDRRRGRGSALIPSPVKEAAADIGLPVAHDLAALAEDADRFDLAVVVAYGRIIPVSLLRMLPMINIHFSLLPRWRGAAPVERAILAGDTETGVCLMEVAEGLDEGGVYASRSLPITDDATATELRATLAVLGADLLVEAVAGGLAKATPQDGTPTYARKLDRAEQQLDFTQPAIDVHRRVRIGRAWSEFRHRRIGVERTAVADGQGHPGALAFENGSVFVDTPDGRLQLVEVRPEGKRTMSAVDWYNGAQPDPGERLGVASQNQATQQPAPIAT